MAEIEPLLMIRPPRGLCAFITRNASRRTEECAGEVRVDDAPPLLDGEILDRNGRRTNAGVVEQEIESPERAHRLLKELTTESGSVTSVGTTIARGPAPEASAVSVSGSARRPASAHRVTFLGGERVARPIPERSTSRWPGGFAAS